VKVAAVILAAGASTRLGEPKQLVMLGGERLLERAVRIAVEAGCEPVLVVLGAQAEEIRSLCALNAAEVVLNPDWQSGMASSVHAGTKALPAHADGLVLMTCDQPSVSAQHLRRLMDSGGGDAVGSSYGGRIGVPAFFPVARCGELLGLSGDQGARSLLETARAVELPEGELDIDTAESLEEARRIHG
jgi:molybdenum cofactor cytidylyltransferase